MGASGGDVCAQNLSVRGDNERTPLGAPDDAMRFLEVVSIMRELLTSLNESLRDPGFCNELGIEARDWDAKTKTLTLAMPMADGLQGGAGPGHMHGGAIGAFIDTAATFALLADGVKSCPTVNYRIDLMRPVVDSGLEAHATVRRRGKTLAVVDVEVLNNQYKVCALGRATFAILD